MDTPIGCGNSGEPSPATSSKGPKLILKSDGNHDDAVEKSPKSTRFPASLWVCISRLRRQREPKILALSNIRHPSCEKTTFPNTVASSCSMMHSSIEAEPYSWPHDKSFDPKTTALVIIDMQMDFCSPEGYMGYQGYDISATRAIIPRLQTLLTVFRKFGFSIYHTREGHRPDLSTLSARELHRSRNNASGLGIGDRGPLGRLLIRGEAGHEIIPELRPLESENVIDKPGRSAFQHTDFGLLLSVRGVRNLLLCGVTTDVCVASTMRDANDNNFDCLLISDATAAAEPHLHDAAIDMVKSEGGIFGAVSSTEKILAALGVAAGDGGGIDKC